jgi:septum formation topological specificity factor MinE
MGVDIAQEDVTISLDTEEDCEILELNIALPEKGRYKEG